MTFTIETIDGKHGIWLCINDNHSNVPIAKFLSKEKATEFTQVLNLIMAKSHAQGQLGI